MRVERTADWTTEVLPSWRRAAVSDPEPNRDIWGHLPSGVRWMSATIEKDDIAAVHVLGSHDWALTFGGYRLEDVAARADEHAADDEFQHRSRIVSMAKAYAAGSRFEPIVMVAPWLAGPFVIIDGNHRAAALQRCGALTAGPVYLGVHAMVAHVSWYCQATGSPPPSDLRVAWLRRALERWALRATVLSTASELFVPVM